MGGKPFLALNLAAMPPALPNEVVSEILRGGAEKTREAGVVLAGGHTIQDKEPKYGLVVLGFAHPQHMLTKSGARPGDLLVMSKPLGFGTVTTALKRGVADEEDLAEAVRWMQTLNKTASELAVKFELQGGMDVTGFGLLGHASEMALASGVGLRFFLTQMPFTRGAQDYAADWIFPGGSSDNRLFFGLQVRFAAKIEEIAQMLLFDAQTSGGLLLAVPARTHPQLLQEAAQIGQPLWTIGEGQNQHFSCC